MGAIGRLFFDSGCFERFLSSRSDFALNLGEPAIFDDFQIICGLQVEAETGGGLGFTKPTDNSVSL